MEWRDFNQSDCRANYSYFWSADYLRNAYHITAFFTIPLSLFTFYTIVKVTPKRMKSMKTPLLIAHAWSVNLDLMFTVYSAPYVFAPSASGVPLGLLGALGVGVKWQSYWGQVSLTMMGVCLIMLFENRQNQITTIKLKIKNKRTRLIYFGFNYVFALVVMLPFYLESSDQAELRKIILQRIPCSTIEFWDPKTYVLLKGGEITPFWSITIGFSAIFFQALFFLFPTIYHLTMVSNAKVSDATKNLQKKFLGYVSIQMEWRDFNQSDCRANYSYFWSSDYLRNAYHITAFFTIPLSLFTFYTIVKVTPKRMKSMKTPLLIAHAWSVNLDLMFTVYSAPYVFAPSASGVPLGLLGALGRIPCPTIEFWDPKTYVLLKGGEVTPFWSITIGFSAIVFQAFFFLLPTIYHLTMATNARVSVETKNLQKKFLIYVSIQVSVPWISIAFPTAYIMYSDKINYYNQAYNNNSMLIMANHGFLSTCSTLFIYKPYRDFVVSVLTGKKEEAKRMNITVGTLGSRVASVSN
ncbi:unnamed protein product [Caenorhabditis brenneri]